MLGYRRAEVDAALDSAAVELDAAGTELAVRDRRIDELERVSNRLAERVVEREHELRRVRAELAASMRHSAVSMDALAALTNELEAMRRRARGAPAGQAKTLAAAEESAPPVPAAAPDKPAAPMPEAVPAQSNGHSKSAAAGLFEGCIEVEIGPFGDFAQLVGFEDAARGIDATSEISIVRFSDGRATLEMTLREPVELLDELERRCDLDFRVRDDRDGRIVLDVD